MDESNQILLKERDEAVEKFREAAFASGMSVFDLGEAAASVARRFQEDMDLFWVAFLAATRGE